MSKRWGVPAAWLVVVVPLTLFPLPGNVSALDAQNFHLPVFNGYLDQLNVLECVNPTPARISGSADIYENNATLLGSIPVSIPAFGSRHQVLNTLDIHNKHGVIRLRGSLEGKSICYTTFYRFAHSTENNQLNYAFAIPAANILTGDTSGIFNSMNPAGSELNPTYNWLSLYNPSEDISFAANVLTYHQNGSLAQTKRIQNLLPGRRIDIPLGHPDGKIVGIYKIIPDDKELPYGAFLARYGANLSGDYDFGLVLFPSTPIADTGQVSISTMGPAINWVEIGNPNAVTSSIVVEFRDQLQRLLFSTTRNVPPNSQIHLYANDVLGMQNIGSVRAYVASGGPVVLSSMMYGLGQNGIGIKWSYGAQPNRLTPENAVSVAPINTFLNAANWYKRLQGEHQAAYPKLSIYGPGANQLITQLDLISRLDFSIHDIVGPDTIGMLHITPTNGPLSGEVIRVFPAADGSIASIMRLPLTTLESDSNGGGPGDEPPPGGPPVDTDNDTLPDEWEFEHFGTLAYSPTDDPDGDGLTNIQEYLYGTDPNVAEINLLLNPSFEQGLTSWQAYIQSQDSGDNEIVVVDDGVAGAKAVRINNPSGDDIGLSQKVTFNAPIQQPLFISYWAKANTLSTGALASLNITIEYANAPVEYQMGPLQLLSDDIGMWVNKQYVIYPTKPVTAFTFTLLNYSSHADVVYDNIQAYLLPDSLLEQFTIHNGSNTGSIAVSSAGYIRSVYLQNEQVLVRGAPLGYAQFTDGTTMHVHRLTQINPGVFKAHFGNKTWGGLEAEIEISGYQGHAIFHLANIINYSGKTLDWIDFLSFKPTQLPDQNKSWAESAQASTPFLLALPITVDAVCTPRHEAGYSWGYGCKASRHLELVGSKAALMAARKDLYDITIQHIHDLHIAGTGTRDIVLKDGHGARTSSQLGESYLFARVTSSNYETILNFVTRGGFKQLLLIDPLQHGNYLTPRNFSNLDAFYAAMTHFKNQGVAVGIHTFASHINDYDSMVDFANPPIPLHQILFSQQVGTLTQNLSASSTNLVLDTELAQNQTFRHYFLGHGTSFTWTSDILINNELINCSVYSGATLSNCTRGFWTSQAAAHPAGSAVYLAPRAQWRSWILNPLNTQLLQQASHNLASVAQNLGLSMLYFDGVTFANLPEMDSQTSLAYMHKHGLVPLLNAVEHVPLLQFGSGTPPFGWYYESRAASNDGAVFKNKNYTKYKLDSVVNTNLFAKVKRREFGWWKIHGSQIGTGIWDFAATTSDDVHYVMSKVLALDSSIGVQLGSFYEEHNKINDLFDLIGQYNQLIENIRSGQTSISTDLLEYIKDPANEAELKLADGWQLRKKRTIRTYSDWSTTSEHTTSFHNPFDEQPLTISIRAVFDYYPWADARHTLITNFQDTSTFSISTSHTGVLCNIQNGGSVSVINNSSTEGFCRVSIPISTPLTFKRGLGLSLVGNSNNEVVVVRAEKAFEVRDFKFLVDFDGHKELLLGDPTGDYVDYFADQQLRGDPRDIKSRNWDFDYSDPSTFVIFIKNVQPNSSSSLQFLGLKGLQEKGYSELVQPVITVGDHSIQFPVTLSATDNTGHILEYNGLTGAYRVLSSNYDVLESGTIDNDDIILPTGANSLSISSSTTNSEFSRRAEVHLTIYEQSPP